ncbi:cgi-121-domain-containing protein [Alternaria burnsii]|uniref:EKC/KEOPS complex subunit CGI121 n=1 Tax=Alternaria burnsii TaxID=1187904 RepID=A0A8H7AZS8_9PLEO|nr:cgi-121-domain-containing protein [Alternaria burnsii]KAF7674611.1 cgi-121-domain-containing protein [Alternaria burnsii]
MASVRTFSLPHYEAYPVHVALFKDVKNASFLRRQLLEANPDYDYAFLDASMILTPHHLLSATFLALHGHLTHRAKTRTPHSELVFRLSPNNNIGESYKKFGIADTTTALIAVKLPLSPSSIALTDEKSTYEKDESITNESVSSHLGSAVEGTSVELGETGEELGMWCDVDKVKKVYKLGGDGGKKGKRGAVNGNGGDVERRKAEEKKDIESVVLGIIALKGS